MRRCLADTAVFIYADGEEHPYRASCQALIEQVAKGLFELETSVEIVQEYTYVQLRAGRERSNVLARAREIGVLCRLHAFEPNDAELMIGLLGSHERLDSRDAVLAATAFNRGIELILSPDRDFDGIPGLTRVDPADEQAVASLAEPA